MFLSQLHFRPQEHSQPLKHKAVNLCQSCSTIFSRVDVSSRLRSRSGLKIHKMRWGMVQTAIQGCEFCRRLLPTWAEDFEKYKVERGSTSDKELKFSFHLNPKAVNQIVASRHRRLGHAFRTSFDISTTLGMVAMSRLRLPTLMHEHR
jgi:hypothetical protein